MGSILPLMNIVTPAVLPSSREALEAALGRLDGLVPMVQIDVVDGRFAAPASWPYAAPTDSSVFASGGELPYLGHFKFEVDLMVESPEESAGAWVEAGAARVVVHIESARNVDRLLAEFARRYGHEKGFAPDLIAIGLALNIDTETSAIEPYLDSVDFVQFMGISRIGVQGQPFDDRVLRKIEAFKRAHPDMAIQVDGGVTEETAPRLLALGVDRLVVGHAVIGAEDIGAKLHQFDLLAEEYGRYR